MRRSSRHNAGFDIAFLNATLKRAAYTAPLGPTAPLVALCVCIALAAGATRAQMFGGVAALAVGGLMYALSPAQRARAEQFGIWN